MARSCILPSDSRAVWPCAFAHGASRRRPTATGPRRRAEVLEAPGDGQRDDTGPAPTCFGRRSLLCGRPTSTSTDFSAIASDSSPLAAAERALHVRLRALGGHGTMARRQPPRWHGDGDRAGPVAVITRADVRRRSWRDFAAAGKEVDAELHTAAGLIDVVGVGEAPVGRLATFSLWESAQAACATTPTRCPAISR